MPVFMRVILVAGLLIAMTAEAGAYGGPGAAITLVGSLIGVGVAIFASLFYVVAWPLRRMLKKRKGGTDPAPGNEAPAEAVTGAAVAMAEDTESKRDES